MPSYSREQLEALASTSEQERGYDTSHHPSHINTYHAPPPAPRDIRRAIYDAVYSAGRASRADIAKALGVRKTPWLTAHVERLVSEGYLVKLEGIAKNGAQMFFYEVAS